MVKIFAVDFDDTIAYTRFPEIIGLVPFSIEVMKEIQEQGDQIILYTCRTNENLKAALDFLKANGFTPDYANENSNEGRYSFLGNSRKIYADVYIDDKHDNYIVDWLEIRKRHVKKYKGF